MAAFGSTASNQAEEADVPESGRSYWRESWSSLQGNKLGMAAGIVLLIFAVIAILAPAISTFVTHFSPDSQDPNELFGGFSRQHLLGTDELGRDVATRLVYGARVSLGVGFLTVAIYIAIGGVIGLIAGYYGGWIDELLMRLVDVLLSLPAIYLLILITSLLPLPIGSVGRPVLMIQHDALSLAVIIALVSWGGVARLMRGEVLSLKDRDFVHAARSIGAGDFRIMLAHVVPNALPVMIVVGSLGVGAIILLEAALDFIGLGVQPPTPSWGDMLSNAQSYFFHAPNLVALPGLAIVVTVMAANVLGNAIRESFDPRLV